MATVLEGYITEEHRSVVLSLWAEELNAKDSHQKIFPLYVRKCLSRETAHDWVEKFAPGHSKVADDARPSV
jgi:hypothetical protein